MVPRTRLTQAISISVALGGLRAFLALVTKAVSLVQLFRTVIDVIPILD